MQHVKKEIQQVLRMPRRLPEESNVGLKRPRHNTLSYPVELHLLRNVAKTLLLFVLCILSHGQNVESVLGYPVRSCIVIHHIEDVRLPGAVRFKVPLPCHLLLVEA